MIHRFFSNSIALAGFVCLLGPHASAQQPLTWAEIQQRFDAANPTLRAGQLNIDESKAQEITAFLRPNPDMSLSLDQFNPFTTHPYRPFSQLQPGLGVSYLYERLHKRDLRKESAVEATTIATSTQEDLHRTLTYTLRNAFVQTLQAKAVLALAKENLDYYDKLLEVNRVRFRAGDIAQVDLDRLELQRIQYLSDIQNAYRKPSQRENHSAPDVERPHSGGTFEITGPYDSPTKSIRWRISHHRARHPARSAAAIQAVEKARTDHKLANANGIHRSDFRRRFRPAVWRSYLLRVQRRYSRCGFSTEIRGKS